MNNKVKSLTVILTVAIMLLGLALSASAMKLSVSVSADSDNIVLDVIESDGILSVKEQLSKITGVKPEKQVLKFAGMPLADNKTLSDYGITSSDVLTMEKIAEESTEARDTETEEETTGGFEADGEIIFGSLLVNSSNVRTVAFIFSVLVLIIIVVFIALKRRSDD